MTLFIWRRSYEINVPEIDVQHRRLIGMINELSDAMMMGQGQRAVPHILEELLDYVQLHFTTEERIMRNNDYPPLEEHCQQHLELTNRFMEFRDQFIHGQEFEAKELLDFLCDWWKNHITIKDKAFGKYVQRRELGLEK